MPKKKKLRVDPATLSQSFSKNLLGLKFMQRAQKEADTSREDLYYSDDESEEDDGNTKLEANESTIKKKCILNPSYQFCERLRFGRFSFQGMNLDIETLMYNNNEMDSSLKVSDTTTSTNASKKRPAPDSSSSSDTCSNSGHPSEDDKLDEG